MCYQVEKKICIATPLPQSEPGLSAKDVAGFGKREKLLRQLSSLENGPIADLEKANAERKQLLRKASLVLDKLVSTATATRLEMKRRDEAAAESKDILEATRKRVTQVGQGGAASLDAACPREIFKGAYSCFSSLRHFWSVTTHHF